MSRTSTIAALLSIVLWAASPPAAARDGVPDPSFGSHAPGISVVDIVPDPEFSVDEATALVALPDGGLLLGGISMYDMSLPTAVSLVRLDASGQRDAAFGNGGATLIDPGAGVSALRLAAMLPRADGGSLVLARGVLANAGMRLLCRVDAGGTLEAACVPLPAPPGLVMAWAPMAAALDGEGRLVTVASVTTPAFSWSHNLSVARWQPDGSPDTGFGNGGATTITHLDELAGQATREVVAGIAVDTQGRIVIAASSQPRGPAGDGTTTFAAARLLASGQVDTTFGDGGARLLTTTLPLGANALALTADGSLYIAGSAVIEVAPTFHTECAVARFDADGGVDTGFGDAGLRRLAFHAGAAAESDCTAIASQPDGRVVVAGYSRTAIGSASGYDLAAARLWPDGRLDTGFGNSGDGRYIGALDLAAEFGNHDRLDAILWHGEHLVAAGTTRTGYNLFEFAAVRLRADGLLDDGFD